MLRLLVPTVLGLGALLVFLVVAADAELDAATAGLLLAALGLLFCMRALFNVVQAVAHPTQDAHVVSAGLVAARELREEKRRLLRAINELRFDYELGKLSEADYLAVREGYELRAVEVMRALDQDAAQLRPELAAELRERGVRLDGEHAEEPSEAPEDDDASETLLAVGDDDPETLVAGNEAVDERPSAVVMADDFDDDDDDDQMETVVRRRCNECSTTNERDARFCKACGLELT